MPICAASFRSIIQCSVKNWRKQWFKPFFLFCKIYEPQSLQYIKNSLWHALWWVHHTPDLSAQKVCSTLPQAISLPISLALYTQHGQPTTTNSSEEVTQRICLAKWPIRTVLSTWYSLLIVLQFTAGLYNTKTQLHQFISKITSMCRFGQIPIEQLATVFLSTSVW